MKKRKFPFIKFCDWLYQSAIGAGILFVLYGFLQKELARAEAFPQTGAFLGIITAVTFAVQLILVWSGEKPYRLQAFGLGLLLVNIAVGLFISQQQPDFRMAFWCYVGLEAACIAASAIAYVIRRLTAVKGAVILAQAASLVAMAVLEKPLSAWCVCIMFTAFLLFLVEITANGRKEITGLLPMFAAAMLIICLIPQSAKPMDWSWVSEAYTAVQEQSEMLITDLAYMLNGEDEFSFNYTGYGNNSGKLGGINLDSKREQLHIVGNGTKNPLYLTGSTYDIYTGEGWEASPKPAGETSVHADVDILKALRQSVYAEQADKLTYSCLMSVEYRFIKTADFFHELNTTNLYGNPPQFAEDSFWKLEKAHGKDYTYQFRFLEINRNSDEIKALMRQQAWKENAVWDTASLRRETEIYSAYTQLPDNIPQRVYDLAHTLAADADNDYDRMTAFADYLKDYTYTKAPPERPDGQEFTDYFLFDSKSGYCTYFATAMAVLGRCEGIPTRYVQGFMTPDTCNGARFDVPLTGDRSHAWTEVYIEHVGWVRFDATPGYGGTSGADRWKPLDAIEIGQTENPYANDRTPQEKPDEEPEKQGKPAQWYAKAALEITAAFLVGSVMIAVLVVLLRNFLRRRKYSRADALEKLRIKIKLLLRLGRLRGTAISEGETLEAYGERTCGMLDTDGYSFAEACGLYEGIRFGAKNASPDELRRFENYAASAERAYLADCGFLRKIIYYIL